MKAHPTGLPGVVLLEPALFSDDRGAFMETWNLERYRAAGVPSAFVQSNQVRSARGVLRGLHYQVRRPQAKLVWAIEGEIYDVAVDVRRGSPTFGRWHGAVLSAANRRQLFVPEGFAHGYAVLGAESLVAYLCSDLYSPADERGIRWDDPRLAIDWPAGDEWIVSPKDAALPVLEEAELP